MVAAVNQVKEAFDSYGMWKMFVQNYHVSLLNPQLLPKQMNEGSHSDPRIAYTLSLPAQPLNNDCEPKPPAREPNQTAFHQSLRHLTVVLPAGSTTSHPPLMPMEDVSLGPFLFLLRRLQNTGAIEGRSTSSEIPLIPREPLLIFEETSVCNGSFISMRLPANSHH